MYAYKVLISTINYEVISCLEPASPQLSKCYIVKVIGLIANKLYAKVYLQIMFCSTEVNYHLWNTSFHQNLCIAVVLISSSTFLAVPLFNFLVSPSNNDVFSPCTVLIKSSFSWSFRFRTVILNFF